MLNTQSMNLDLIRTFVIVGQSKDFNDAASKLKIDATNVSRHIKALEQLMGTKLINKNAKNYIELTEDGQILFDGYEKAYNLLFITEKTYLQSKDLNSGKISIGISADIESTVLIDKIVSFKDKYPDAAFKTINLPSKDLVEKLSHYTLDFVIDEKSDNYKKSSGVKSIDLYEEKYSLVYNKDNFSINDITDLKDLPMILPVSTKKERKIFDNFLDKNNLTKKLSIETSNYLSAIEYAKKGLGIALIPSNMIDNELEHFDIDITKVITLSYIENNLSPLSIEFLKEFN